VGLSKKPEVKTVRFGYPTPQNRTLRDTLLQCMKEKINLKLRERVKKDEKEREVFIPKI